MDENPDYTAVSPAYPPRGRLYNAVHWAYDRAADSYRPKRISPQLERQDARALAIRWADEGGIDFRE